MSTLKIKVYHDGDSVRVIKQHGTGQETKMFTLSPRQSAEVSIDAPFTVHGMKYSDRGSVTDAVVPITGTICNSMVAEQQKAYPDFDVNSANNVFMQGVSQAPEASAREILNWYRNLYYKEPQHTERGCIAWAINEVLKELLKAEEVTEEDAKE